MEDGMKEPPLQLLKGLTVKEELWAVKSNWLPKMMVPTPKEVPK